MESLYKEVQCNNYWRCQCWKKAVWFLLRYFFIDMLWIKESVTHIVVVTFLLPTTQKRFSMWLYSLQVASIFIILVRWRGLFVCSGKKVKTKQKKRKKNGKKKKIPTDFRLWITWTLGCWIQPDTQDDEQAMGFKRFFKNPGASALFWSSDGMSDEENTRRWYLAFILTKLGWLDLQLNQLFTHEFSLAWLLDCSRTPLIYYSSSLKKEMHSFALYLI